MPKKSSASPETRAAVLASLLAGQSVSQVAKEYQLPVGTVASWKNRKVVVVASNASNDATDATQKSQQVGDLLYELVQTNLKGLISVAKLLTDQEWLKQQGAAELGTLAGITCDKSIRILEAMAREQQSVPQPALPPAK